MPHFVCKNKVKGIYLHLNIGTDAANVETGNQTSELKVILYKRNNRNN